MTAPKLFGKLFRITFLFIIFVEIVSYAAYFYPTINTVGFFLILLFTLLLSLKKLEYGVYLILAELFIGSKGYLFFFDISGTSISIRLGLFLVVLGVWIFKLLKNKRLEFRSSNLFKWYLLLFLFIIWGVINGFLKGNEFNHIFFDFNGWLFLGLVFVFYTALNSWERIQDSMQVIFAATSAVILKTVLLLFFFSHEINYLLPSLYKWIRITGVGEITQMPNNFYRIFFQSHIFAIFIFFIIALLLIELRRNNFSPKDYYGFWIIGFFSALVTFVSSSRSFWLGALLGLVALFYLIFFILKLTKKKTFVITGSLILTFIGVYVITLGVINFPWPTSSGFKGGLIEERTKDLTTEAGASSRFQLLPPLSAKIKEHAILGSGFGATVTYKTNDPRALETNPDGLFTTYAFEWGYLDIWVKIGLIGLLVYLLLIFKLFQKGWQLAKKFSNQPFSRAFTLGLLVGLFVLVMINATTPYLNHPLGIGYLIFLTAVFSTMEANSSIPKEASHEPRL